MVRSLLLWSLVLCALLIIAIVAATGGCVRGR
jgi:hypothetical protein